ncbi:unnamed protein product [Durusdinium trenchii]|uniref:Uncharacterized protein n=1 Tax=Durusdinium trenchii TaxID=1381693 RepID=A0ABP0IVF9_9DINO
MQKAFAIRLMAFASFGLVCVEFKLVTVSCSLWALLVLPENLGAPSSMSAGGESNTENDFYVLSGKALEEASAQGFLNGEDTVIIGFYHYEEGDLATFFPSAKSEHGAPPQRCLLLAGPQSEGASFRVAMLFRNASAWPEVTKAESFPRHREPVVFECRPFSTAGEAVVLIPDTSLGLDAPPQAHADLTRELNVAVVKLPVLKYVSFLRGMKRMDRGYSSTSVTEDSASVLSRIVR